jgi:hypothetical protein
VISTGPVYPVDGRRSAIVGGTGQFKKARGTVTRKVVDSRTQFTSKVLYSRTIITAGSDDQGVVTGPPHRGAAVRHLHGWLRLVSSTALKITRVTASGCDTMDAWEAVTSSIRAFPRSAMNR